VSRKPDGWSATDQAVGLFLLGLIYALVLGWLAVELAGGGHGTGFFLNVCLPGPLLWPAAGIALAYSHGPLGRWICPAIVIIQYLLCLGIIAASENSDESDLARVWMRAPSGILTFTTVFLTGQAVLWGTYVTKRWQARGEPSKGRVTLMGMMMAMAVLALLLAMVTIPARWVVAHRHFH